MIKSSYGLSLPPKGFKSATLKKKKIDRRIQIGDFDLFSGRK